MFDTFFPAGFFIFIFAVISIATIFWIWMLVDSITRKFINQVEKIVWIISLLFFHLLAAIVYYFAVKRSNPDGIIKTV